jgi:hypothetical protein
VWRGLNTADSADSYMAGYSPAALSAPSFSRSVSCEPHQPLHTFHGGMPTTEFSSVTNEIRPTPQQRDLANAQLEVWKSRLSLSVNRLQSPGFHWALCNVQIKHFPRGQLERVNRRGFTHVIVVVYFTLREEWLVLLSYLFQSLRFPGRSICRAFPQGISLGRCTFSIDAPFCQLLERCLPR